MLEVVDHDVGPLVADSDGDGCGVTSGGSESVGNRHENELGVAKRGERNEDLAEGRNTSLRVFEAWSAGRLNGVGENQLSAGARSALETVPREPILPLPPVLPFPPSRPCQPSSAMSTRSSRRRRSSAAIGA